MCERIDTGRRNIRIVHQIELGVEVRPRIAPFLPAELIKVGERVSARLFHVLIEREIERGREKAIWIASFVPARLMIVLVGIDVCVPDIVIVRIVEQIVDQRIAVVVIHGAISEHVGLKAGQHRVAAARPIDDHMIAREADRGIGEIEIEAEYVVARAAVKIVGERQREISHDGKVECRNRIRRSTRKGYPIHEILTRPSEPFPMWKYCWPFNNAVTGTSPPYTALALGPTNHALPSEWI